MQTVRDTPRWELCGALLSSYARIDSEKFLNPLRGALSPRVKGKRKFVTESSRRRVLTETIVAAGRQVFRRVGMMRTAAPFAGSQRLDFRSQRQAPSEELLIGNTAVLVRAQFPHQLLHRILEVQFPAYCEQVLAVRQKESIKEPELFFVEATLERANAIISASDNTRHRSPAG